MIKKSEGSNSRRQNVKKDKNRNNNSKKSTPFSESIQPDPRWAAELMKLKDMYEKQTT